MWQTYAVVDPNRIVLSETTPLSGMSAIVQCAHTPHIPVFQAETCTYNTTEWVRTHYPRFSGICTVCRQGVIMYANIAHMRAGGWC